MDIRTIIVKRTKIGYNQSIGTVTVKDGFGATLYSGVTLERGWRNNERNVSCIPKGHYPIRLEWSNRFSTNLWEIHNVPNRSECKFHAANYWHQLNGCIAIGLDLKDINYDGLIDVISSKVAMRRFHEAMGNAKDSVLIIKDV
tara:strand:+ start:912 stop:1340 length:429 start_codon:yes stop_codon:yes gene_type:complete